MGIIFKRAPAHILAIFCLFSVALYSYTLVNASMENIQQIADAVQKGL